MGQARLAIVAALAATALRSADTADPREQLVRYLNGIAQAQLEKRKQAVAQIRTREDAEKRKKLVREKILGMLGGLPERNGAVAVKEFGGFSADGFRVEKVAYESLPGFWV